MNPIPALDFLLERLLRTCSLTNDNHVPLKFHFTPELKLMVKISWIFSETPDLANHGITSQESLTRYLKSNRSLYVLDRGCVSTRKIFRGIPSELEALIILTKILHKQNPKTIESLQALIDHNKILKRRLRNTNTLQDFLQNYSQFFVTEPNGSIRPLIQIHYECNGQEQYKKKVDSLIVIQLIRGYIHQVILPINLFQLHTYLHKIGFGVSVADLGNFLLKFYLPSHVSRCPEPEQVNTKPRQPLVAMSQNEINESIDDALKRWPVSLSTIRENLNKANVSINNSALRAIIEGHFPDFVIKDGVVSKNYERYVTPVQKILTKKCPLSLTELRNKLESHGIEISMQIMIDLVVRHLEKYFIYGGQICLSTSKVSGARVANLILSQISFILVLQPSILMEDLVLKMASRAILITEGKLKTIIEKHSTMLRCKEDCVCRIDCDLQNVPDKRTSDDKPRYNDPQPLRKQLYKSTKLNRRKYIGKPTRRRKTPMNANIPETYEFKDLPEGRLVKRLQINFENRVRHRDKLNFKRNKDPKNSFRLVGKPK